MSALWQQAREESAGSCAFYLGGGVFCAADPEFSIRLAGESRLRKARMACPGHLVRVIRDMRDDHAGYAGEFTVIGS